MIRRDEAVARIREHADAIRALGAKSLFLYGSLARDEAGPGSDIDVFVDRDPEKRFTFVELTELEFLLRDILRADVDVSTRTGLHPEISGAIESYALKIL